MGRKGIASIFSKHPAGADESSPPWPWPSCRNPQTASFRDKDRRRACSTTAAAVGRNPSAAAMLIRGGAGEMYKTVNSVYQLDYISADGSCFDDDEEEEEGEQGALELDDDDGFSTTTASEEWSEALIRSLGRTSTDRFFVDPGPASNSILALSPGKPAAAATAEAAATSEETEPSSLVEESVAVAVDSEDPYGDFRASMEEMVAAHGLRGWEALEELLVWYLRINGKHNHALIVGAFVDLLVGLAAPPASSSSAAPTATTTATTMTTATSSVGGGSTVSTSTSSSTCGDTTPTTTAPTEEQCGASRSHASSDKSLHDKEEDVVGDKAGDDRSISSTH